MSKSELERRVAVLETAVGLLLVALKSLVPLVKDDKQRAGLERSLQEAERALF